MNKNKPKCVCENPALKIDGYVAVMEKKFAVGTATAMLSSGIVLEDNKKPLLAAALRVGEEEVAETYENITYCPYCGRNLTEEVK